MRYLSMEILSMEILKIKKKEVGPPKAPLREIGEGIPKVDT